MPIRLRDTRWEATPLGWANEGGEADIIELLIDRHPPDILDACQLGLVARATELLDTDSDLARAPGGSGGALRIAAWHGHLELVRLLLDRGAEPNRVNEAGASAVDYARSQGHDAIVALLERQREA